MGSGFAKKKKQARMMQEQISQMRNNIQDVEMIGTAGNGLVTVTLNGEHEIKQIKIKPECVDPEDVEGLEDLIKLAHQDALQKLNNKLSEQMPSGLRGMLS